MQVFKTDNRVNRVMCARANVIGRYILHYYTGEPVGSVAPVGNEKY